MNNILFKSNIFKSLNIYNGRLVGRFNKSTSATTETEAESEEGLTESTGNILFEDEETESNEEMINRNRNKSRLTRAHRRMLKDTVPYDEAQSWIHLTVKYKRGLIGKYGLASNVDPRICFYSERELAEQAEYERVAHPFTLQHMVEENKKIKMEKEQIIRKREDDIEKKLLKLDTWTKDLEARVANKEADAKAVKEKKDRLVEEVRRQFGFKLDTRDDRFKALLAEKEKEDKKKLKLERKKMKDKQMLAKLLAKHEAPEEKSSTTAEKKADTDKLEPSS